MKRKGNVYYAGILAGQIIEDEDHYVFFYAKEYLQDKEAKDISLSLPLTNEKYESKRLFPFFDGLIPEGWLLETATKNWKLNPRDRMGLLLSCCHNTIGAVTVKDATNE